MKHLDRIHREFKERYGSGYSATEVSNAAPQESKTIHADTIRRYVSKHSDLAIDLKKAKINLRGSNIGSLIPKSKLAALMEGMGIEGTIEGLIERMEFQRSKSDDTRIRHMSKKYSRYY